MPSFLNVKNNAASILASGITAVATSLTVAPGEGARFPASNFHITIEDEILKCTTRTGDVLTVTRAQEGTAAAAHDAAKAVRLNITAAIIQEIQGMVNRVVWKDASESAFSNVSISATIDWTDLDLTPYTSADAKFAILLIKLVKNTIPGAVLENYLLVRKNGTTPTVSPCCYLLEQELLYQQDIKVCIVGLDAGQVIEYKVIVAAGGSVQAYIDVLGYIE